MRKGEKKVYYDKATTISGVSDVGELSEADKERVKNMHLKKVMKEVSNKITIMSLYKCQG